MQFLFFSFFLTNVGGFMLRVFDVGCIADAVTAIGLSDVEQLYI